MPARRAALFVSAWNAVPALLVLSLTLGSIALSAQQTPAANPPATAASDPLPALQAALEAARSKGDAQAEANALLQIAGAHAQKADTQAAIDSLREALVIQKRVADPLTQARTLGMMGILEVRIGRTQEALDDYTQGLDLMRAAGNVPAQALALDYIGAAWMQAHQPQKAYDSFEQELALRRQTGDRKSEAGTLGNMAMAQAGLHQQQKALDLYQQGLAIQKEIGDRVGLSTTLAGMADSYSLLNRPDRALDYYNQALPILHELNRGNEAIARNNAGVLYLHIDELQKALDQFNLALDLNRQFGNRGGEAGCLNNISNVYEALGETSRALETNQQILPIWRSLHNRYNEAMALSNIGMLQAQLGDLHTALDPLHQALAIDQELGDKQQQETALTNIATVDIQLGELQSGMDTYKQALDLARAAADRAGEAKVLSNIGNAYSEIGEPKESLEAFDQAIAIEREITDRRGENVALNNKALALLNLGEPQQAIDAFTQILARQRDAGARGDAGVTLTNLGSVYETQGQMQKALDCFNEALGLEHEANNRAAEAGTLENLAHAWLKQGDAQQGLEISNRVLDITHSIGNPHIEALALANIGYAQFELGHSEAAIDADTRVLAIATELNNPLLRSRLAADLMRIDQKDHPDLAIFYGKQAVNQLQRMRGDIRSLDRDIQKSFIASKETVYRRLADVMIAQGRLPEAQQVLDLLKEQEYSEFVRGDTSDKTASPLSLTPEEQKAEADYETATAKTAALSEELSRLNAQATRTPEEEARLKELSDQIAEAGKGLDAWYQRLYAALGPSGQANQTIADMQDKTGNLQSVIANLPGTVALYTLVTGDRYRVLFITGNSIVAREYAITEAALNRKVEALKEALRDPEKNALAPAQDLYKIVVGPVADLLAQSKAKTVVWELDGTLRYIPVAALHDGTQYMVDRCANVVVTSASASSWEHVPDVAHLRALGLGISRMYERDLEALPAVRTEIESVVSDPQNKNSHGIVPGTIMLDDQFTEKSLEDSLRAGYPIVHIASHFVFDPAAGYDHSWLLTAGKEATSSDGYRLTLADLNNNALLRFHGAELLTLSACETGAGGNAHSIGNQNGREIDGLGTMAQRKDAKAVMASLWEVDDDSTAQLMAGFYKQWVKGAGHVTKAEALRQAQLALLHGDPAHTHPFFWAPFVLMGNWR